MYMTYFTTLFHFIIPTILTVKQLLLSAYLSFIKYQISIKFSAVLAVINYVKHISHCIHYITYHNTATE